MAEPWEVLFGRALAQLRQGGVAENDWMFGGGTVLKLKLNHRDSKDIDIFFNDPQLLGYISPRVNDAVAASLLDFDEHAQHIRLQFREGEIDFIVARQISKMHPEPAAVLGAVVNVEHPVEIVAKKIYHRADAFMPRDVFDLAVVFGTYRNDILRNAEAFAKELPILAKQIDAIERSNELEKWLRDHTILSGGQEIRGKEVRLCKEFIRAVEETLNLVFVAQV